MNHLTQIITGVYLTTFVLLACELAAEEQDDFRAAWNKRLAEHTSVYYEAAGVKISWTTDGKRRKTNRAELRLEARLDTDNRKFRFDVTSKDGGANLHILDRREFHTCVQSTDDDGGWQASSSRFIAPESEWPYFYPFLLARGVVPLPPFKVPRVHDSLANSDVSGEPVRGRETTFTFDGDSPVSVAVAHDSNGLVASYQVTGDQGLLLVIRNTYKRDGPRSRLDRFSVVKFGPDHRPIGRLDAKVTKYETDVPMAASLFIKPRNPEKTREELLALLNKKIDSKAVMTLGELQSAMQEALGDDIRVWISDEAFAGRHEVKLDRLVFEPGEFALSKFLFKDVRRNRLDFHFDAQGIVLVPRSRAWAHAESVDYSPGNYGLTTRQLQDLLHAAGRLDDWSEVGGLANMLTDEEQGRLQIFHAQSDHFQFMYLLSDL